MNDVGLLQTIISALAFVLWAIVAYVLKNHDRRMNEFDTRQDVTDNRLSEHKIEAAKSYATKLELNSSIRDMTETVRDLASDVKTLLR